MANIQDMSGEFISLPNGEILLLLELEIPVIELGRKRGALASRYRRMDVRADADERRSGKRRERRCIIMAYQNQNNKKVVNVCVEFVHNVLANPIQVVCT